MDSIKNVAVIGLGSLGAQIALQSAACGYDVAGFDTDEKIFQIQLDRCVAAFRERGKPSKIDVEKWPEAANKIRMCQSISEAVSEADLVIEAVSEKRDIKLAVWKEIDRGCPKHALLATNSSSMPVSKLEGAVSHPEHCLNLHFYLPVMGHNMVDIMGGTVTAAEVIAAGQVFVRSLNMLPLMVNKEILGFCFNRVWRAVKKEVLHMWANNVVDFRDLDRAWMTFAGTQWGPFALMDRVGLDVVYDIEMVYFNDSGDAGDRPPLALKEKIEAGDLGVKSGRGFYSYPDPEFLQAAFLEP